MSECGHVKQGLFTFTLPAPAPARTWLSLIMCACVPPQHDAGRPRRVRQMIKTPELEQALLVLPFSQVESLANFLVRLLAAGLEVELCARCAVFLLRVHQVSGGRGARKA